MDNRSDSLPTPGGSPVGPGGSRTHPMWARPGWVPVGPGAGSKDPGPGPTQGPHSAPTQPPKNSPVGPGDGDPPALWPNFDPTAPNAYARAWADLWSRTTTDWTPLATIRDHVATAHGLQPKTIANMIRTARTYRHLEHRGGYSQKRQTDTRQIRRRTQETTER